MNNSWCPNLELLFWYTAHFPQSSFTQRKEEYVLHLCHVQYNLLMHLYLNVCWRGREIRREREVEIVKKNEVWELPVLRPVFLGQAWSLQQGARGALWRGWGVCGAVAHGQDVIVAGNVAVPREVVRTLGESGRQAVGSLKNTHCRF